MPSFCVNFVRVILSIMHGYYSYCCVLNDKISASLNVRENIVGVNFANDAQIFPSIPYIYTHGETTEDLSLSSPFGLLVAICQNFPYVLW